MSDEVLKRVTIRLVEAAERCTDLALQLELRKLANELVELIDGRERSKKATQSHYLNWRLLSAGGFEIGTNRLVEHCARGFPGERELENRAEGEDDHIQ
jgi:hypothetical protein